MDDTAENSLRYLPYMGIGLVLVPDLFIWNANTTGQSGIYYPLFLGLVLLAYAVQVKALHRLPSEILITQFGPFAANLITLLARLPLLLFLPVSILVAAGFVFNEVFVRWFPNFGFAGLLLLVVTLAQIFARNHLMNLQSKTVICTGLLWLVLMIAGVTQPGSERAARDFTGTFLALDGAGFILTFVGIDMILSHPLLPADSLDGIKNRMLVVLVITGLMVGIWSGIGLFWMGAAQMTDSHIPHIITARGILGNWGRHIMGAMVILGATAGMNVLFAGLRQVTHTLRRTGYLSLSGRSHGRLDRYAIILVALTVEGLMMVGVAGTDIIDVWVHASLFLWLVYWIAAQSACLLEKRRISGAGSGVLHLVSLLILIIIFLAAIMGYPEKESLFVHVALGAASVAALVTMLRVAQKAALAKRRNEE